MAALLLSSHSLRLRPVRRSIFSPESDWRDDEVVLSVGKGVVLVYKAGTMTHSIR